MRQVQESVPALTELHHDMPLREAVQGLLAQGYSREDVLAELAHCQDALRQTGQDQAEDAVLDVMDFVVGWASPHMKV